MYLAYLRYLLQARNEHSLHSPFLFELYTQIIRPKQYEPTPIIIEQLRSQLRRSRQLIDVLDLGAGSRLGSMRSRTVGEIAQTSAKPAKFAKLLYRLARHMRAKTIVDLGTSLGLTTAYLAKSVADNEGKVITFEGCPNTAAIAQLHLQQLGCANVVQIIGNLDQTLAEQVAHLEQVDLVFFDANHRYIPTIQYFTTCLDKIHNDSVFILDDIHWSPEMEQAWHTIQAHPQVMVTVDLFGIGLVFFRKEQSKQHFIVRF